MGLAISGIRKRVRVHRLFFAAALSLQLLLLQPAFAQAPAPAKARKVVAKVDPEFPPIFKEGHFQARVVAEVTVTPSGSVSNVEIKSGNPMFAEYTAKALMKWKYAPGPSQTVETVNFNFSPGR